jgi:hypothetical protein
VVVIDQTAVSNCTVQDFQLFAKHVRIPRDLDECKQAILADQLGRYYIQCHHSAAIYEKRLFFAERFVSLICNSGVFTSESGSPSQGPWRGG